MILTYTFRFVCSKRFLRSWKILQNMEKQNTTESYFMESCISLPLPPTTLKSIVAKAKDWALMHGVGMRFADNFSENTLTCAPFALFPSTFPKSEFNKAVEIQSVINELMHKVAFDYDFLKNSLSRCIKVDDFTRRLFDIYETVITEGPVQDVALGLLRSDYFLDLQNFRCKQVEVNTIASSFAGLSTQVVKLHRYILTELGHFDKLKNLPENNALQGLCTGMLDAWAKYGKKEACILFIVEDITYNICDQRFHEFELKRLNPEIVVIRRTLTDVHQFGRLDSSKRLFIENHEVAFVYFRAGYSPDHYHSEKEWDARLLMERSKAIKCPSIQYHLAGTKKVQQELTKPGVLEKFLTDVRKVNSLRSMFTGLYSLDQGIEGDEVINMAKLNPSRYVLKPQREGGGSNIYGEAIKEHLEKIYQSEERNAWILMEKITPPLQKNYMIRANLKEPYFTDVISELGVFGVVLGDSKSIEINRQVGHMLRTKVSSYNEGGVAAGWGALDSVYLIDVNNIAKI